MASSTSDSRWSYDVFLSFGSNDVRKGFTGHLFAALCRSGINTFIDEEKLEHWSEGIGEACLKGIKGSRLSLLILSKDYAFSTWCLQELVQILKCNDSDDVWPIFYDVDPSHVEEIKGSYELAFVEHQKRFNEDIIKEWKDALQQVSYLKGLDRSKHFDGHEANNIDHIIEEITRRLSPKMLHVAIHPVGLPSLAKEVISLMAIESEEIRILGIYGMGGIGKSAIAKEVYNSIHHMYKSSCFLENVREDSSSKGIAHLQRKLLSEIFEKKHEKIQCPETGLNVITEKLSQTKVLIVLDDVDERDHIHKILGNSGWLFPGSRVIITTRIKDFLNPSKFYFEYEVDKMEVDDSLRLLSLHAFEQDHPVQDYVSCASNMVDYCGGIPLAIEVLGSSLSGQSVAVWNSRLEKLKVIANDDIHSKLKISYDSLDEIEQFIFLDIACFFIGYDKNYVMKILDGCGFFPIQCISTLIQRCLVKVGSNDKIVMHDLLRDMGREIVRQENAIDPGERSRLWYHEDVIDVLIDKMGTNAVQGLVLNKSGIKYTWSTKTFKKMKMLRLVQLNYVGLTGSYEQIFSKLRWLCWREFPSESIPFDLSLENLIALDMRYSNLTQFMESRKSLEKLKFLNLSHSHKLIEIPNFGGCQNLEKLILKDCIRLEKVGDTIGLLSNLVFLKFQDCKSLKNLPRSIGSLKALEKLNMSGCSKLEMVPDSIGHLVNLIFLSLENCENFQNLPGSIGGLKSLQELTLSGCSKLQVLPESFQFLASLISLTLQNCENLKSLPERIGHLHSLEKLDMSGCSNLEALPESTGHFKSLLFWNLQNCKNLKNFPCNIFGLRSLKKLTLSGCSKLEELPEDLGNLKSLIVLNLDETGIVCLPESIRIMKKLEDLTLRDCPLIFSPGNNSHAIRSLPYSIKNLDLRYCNLLDDVIPNDLQRLYSLKELKLCGNKFTSLPTSICSLPNLDKLYLNACVELRYIPQLQSSVNTLEADGCLSLESIDLKNSPDSVTLRLLGCMNLKELKGFFNLECLQVETVEKLLRNSIPDSIGDFSVCKIVHEAVGNKICPLQALIERGVYSIFLPGNEVPTWFSDRSEGNIVSLQVPEIDAGSTIIGVVTYATYSWKDTSNSCYCAPLLSITNKTKMFDWVYHPNVTFFSSHVDQDISWMCYWIFSNHKKNMNDLLDTGWLFKEDTRQGDELEFSFDMGFGISVRNCGIHLLCQPANQATSLSDELATISSAASRHDKRWGKNRNKRTDESLSMMLEKHEGYQDLMQGLAL
ncbi:disease resistance protein RPV1-like isoform X2 [Euphorbia lathyris]|uniref:disease resistance protein RPV1-like isoform X2 n=1 Tax=Euphorbia lathyris TaxID=212925 RepID=UPI003313A035